jgi:FkbM family methyltransferase
MKLGWKLLKFVPPGIDVFVKRHTSSDFRLWVREYFGGSARSIPDRIVQVKDGRRIHIGPDYIYWPIYIGSEFEPEASSIVRRLLRPGDTVVDAGANYGWYSTLSAQLVGDEGRVHAFEPVPLTYQRLVEHVDINGYRERVTTVQSALGVRDGTVRIHVFDNLSHSRSSLLPLDQNAFAACDVPLTNLNAYLKNADVSRVDFLKCDVEGSELSVFRGAGEYLGSVDAPIVMVELNHETSAAFDYTVDDLINYLRDLGYNSFYAIEGTDRIVQLRENREIESHGLVLCGKNDVISNRFNQSVPSRAAA